MDFFFKPTIKMVQSGTYLENVYFGLEILTVFLRCRLHINFMIQGCQWSKVFFPEDECSPGPGNVFRLDINLVQSGAKKKTF